MRWCGQIAGAFTVEEANELAIPQRAGELPRRLVVIEERAGTLEQVQLMPRGSVYYAIIAMVVFATLVPSFLIACTRVRARSVLAYVAGLACGMVVLVAETYLANGVWWDEVFEVLLLPVLGMVAG